MKVSELLEEFTQICIYIAGQTDRYALTHKTRVSKQEMDLIYLKSLKDTSILLIDS